MCCTEESGLANVCCREEVWTSYSLCCREEPGLANVCCRQELRHIVCAVGRKSGLAIYSLCCKLQAGSASD